MPSKKQKMRPRRIASDRAARYARPWGYHNNRRKVTVFAPDGKPACCRFTRETIFPNRPMCGISDFRDDGTHTAEVPRTCTAHRPANQRDEALRRPLRRDMTDSRVQPADRKRRMPVCTSSVQTGITPCLVHPQGLEPWTH